MATTDSIVAPAGPPEPEVRAKRSGGLSPLTRYLLERRWHPSQKNKKLKDGSLELAFEVAGTKEIKTWIMGFGSLAKVLEPVSLVKEIKDDLAKSLKSYAKS